MDGPSLRETFETLGKAALALVAGVVAVLGVLYWVVSGVGPSYVAAYPSGGYAIDERVALANAMAEGETPQGPLSEDLLHPPGTLLELAYTLRDERGAVYDRWRVRVLVPALPVGMGDDGWNEGCWDGCQAALRRSGGMTVTRSGSAGIADHWLQRMPVGTTFSLGQASFQTQDLLDDEAFVLGITSTRVGDRTVTRPAEVQVTVVAACAAEVRAGQETRLEFFPYAMAPIPKEFVTTNWVQMDGCGSLQALPPRPKPVPVARVATPAPPPFPAGTIVVRRAPATGHSVLAVDEDWLAQHGAPVEFVVQELCRYDAESDRWRQTPMPERHGTTVIEPLTEAQRHGAERVAFELPGMFGLYRVRWRENHPDSRWSNEAGYREALVPVGAMLCEDLALGPAPEGRVAACDPQQYRATARFVPSTKAQCDP